MDLNWVELSWVEVELGKIKFRKEVSNRETKKSDEEDPDIDISIEEIRRQIREEKEAAEGGEKENPVLEESTDSDFTITYEGVPGSLGQDSVVERVRLDRNTSENSVQESWFHFI